MDSWPAPDRPTLPGQGVPLRLFDSATREVRPVAPGPTATMYVCGITPYDATHLGHAATYLAYDIIERVLRDGGHDVTYVQNVTDIDDDILKRAAQIGLDWADLGRRETDLFRADMAALGLLPPTHYVGAIESMDAIVDLIGRLRESGAAYDVENDVYFAVTEAPHFGAVANRSADEMLALAAERGGDPGRPGKRDPLDPLLWLAERPGEPSWTAPWGAGRPGWHVECAAIALGHLGPTIDVHGGGADLAFPHHEMCAAEATVATGQWPFARTWAHTAMVQLAGEKMSKSLGNLVFVRDLRAQNDTGAIRLALLGHHYRESWEWSDADMTAAIHRHNRWRAAATLPGAEPAATVLDGIRRHLADDLDVPGALAVVDRWAERALSYGGSDTSAPAEVSAAALALLGVRL